MTVEMPKKHPSDSRLGAEAQNNSQQKTDAAETPSSTQKDDGGDRISREEGSGAGLYATPESLSSPSTGLSPQLASPDVSSPIQSNPSLNASMFGFSPPQSQGGPRMPNDPLVGSFPAEWQQQQQPRSQPSPSANQGMPGFNFAPLDPSSHAWPSGSGQSQSFGGAGQSMASGSQQNNTAPYPSYGAFGLVDSGGAFPMDLSDFQGTQGADGGNNTDFGFPDCAFVDDTMTMWASAPASFG